MRTRVHLKGLNWTSKKLANGEVRTYFFAWRGGPRLPGHPGDPEFVAAYNRAIATKIAPPSGQLLSVLKDYQQSTDFRRLAERTRKDYAIQIKIIEKEFGTLPLAALDDRRTRAIFMTWRDKLASSSRRQADYAWAVLARILAWALDRGLVIANPCERGGRLYRSGRVDKIWTAEDDAAFLRHAPAHLHLPLILAVWTGARQGDLLRLPWSAYDGKFIRMRQRKTGVRVKIPVGAPLKVALDEAAKTKRGPVILVNSEGRPWTSDGFRASWRKACVKASIDGLTFHDLRGTAVTRLALVGCTEAEIASITGHSLRDAQAILDSQYLSRDPGLAESAIRKLERGTKSQTEHQTVPQCSTAGDEEK
jgi:integrase